VSEGCIRGIVIHHEDGLSPRVEIDEDLHNLAPGNSSCCLSRCFLRYANSSGVSLFVPIAGTQNCHLRPPPQPKWECHWLIRVECFVMM
jgi:hypothetical protein